LRTQSSFSSETINSGKYYPSNYDKPHAVNFIGNYKFSHRFSTSLNVTYSTGRPITLPSRNMRWMDRCDYFMPVVTKPYSGLFPDGLCDDIEGNHRIKKLAHSSWTIGIYNLTGRRNPYSVSLNPKTEWLRGIDCRFSEGPYPLSHIILDSDMSGKPYFVAGYDGLVGKWASVFWPERFPYNRARAQSIVKEFDHDRSSSFQEKLFVHTDRLLSTSPVRRYGSKCIGVDGTFTNPSM